ncbi:MAG: SURF1 family protein [Trueperaceae bacterium]
MEPDGPQGASAGTSGAPDARGRVLLRPRWTFGHLLALVLVVAFVNFGFWQLRRLASVRERITIIEARAAEAPMALDQALDEALDEAVASDTPGDEAGEAAPFPEYRNVVVTGTFDPEHEVLLRGRSANGQPGFHLLTPLAIAEAGEWSGSAVLVERGWVPYDHDSVPVSDAPPPSGTVTVTGELRAPQRPPTDAWAVLAPRDPPDGKLTQSFYADVTRLQPQMPYPLVPAWITLRSSTPPHPSGLPVPVPEHALDEGPHLGYAIQWFAFAVVGVVGYALLLRATLRREQRGG